MFLFVTALPWWIAVLIIIGLSMYLELYLEIIFWGFLYDTLYAERYAFPYTYMTIAAVFFTILILTKSRIRT